MLCGPRTLILLWLFWVTYSVDSARDTLFSIVTATTHRDNTTSTARGWRLERSLRQPTPVPDHCLISYSGAASRRAASVLLTTVGCDHFLTELRLILLLFNTIRFPWFILSLLSGGRDLCPGGRWSGERVCEEGERGSRAAAGAAM